VHRALRAGCTCHCIPGQAAERRNQPTMNGTKPTPVAARPWLAFSAGAEAHWQHDVPYKELRLPSACATFHTFCSWDSRRGRAAGKQALAPLMD
jgi:hypothetical protein